MRLRADFLTGGQFVEHVDQRFVGTLCFMEKPLADRQAAFFHGTVQVEQRFAQLVHRVQVGQMGAFAEGGQFVQQRAELLTFAGVLLPTLQQAFGVQQDVHALGEEVVDQLRVALDSQPGVRCAQEVFQALGQLRPGALGQTPGTGNFRQRIALELAQAEAKQSFCLQQQFDFIQIQRDQVRLVFPGQLIQRRGQFGNRQHTGHISAALEGVQGALQFVAGLQRHMLGGLIKEAIEAAQVGFGLFAKDLQQQRVEGRDILRILIGHRFIALGQGMGAGGQLIDIVALTLGIGGVFSHQLRQQMQHIADQLLHRSPRFHTVFQYAVKQVLHGPGQLAQHQGTHHATTALEGMKGAAQFAQGRAAVRIG
ncbi:hypothetical protein D3C85_805580 [compost metagenome]